MTLSETLGSFGGNYWDFAGYRNADPLIRYPAVMVAPMQACIMKEITTFDWRIDNVLDPFAGSGTVLAEGKKLGLNVIGFDINPLAILLSRVTLEGIPENDFPRSFSELQARITQYIGNIEEHRFKNIDKWFKQEVICSLSAIRKSIKDEQNARLRRFYWCCLAETVRRVSNTRSSTFKLHIKEKSKIDSSNDDAIAYFYKHVNEQAVRALQNEETPNKNIKLTCGDSKKLLRNMEPNSIDLICTSPPYGDNHTTVTYGQFSILQLLWIDKKDLSIWDKNLLEKFNAIDTRSLGGQAKKSPSDVPDNYIRFTENISPTKRFKVINFFKDYEMVFMLMSSVLKCGKLMVLTLGNRRVDNQEIRFDLFNDALAEKYGLKHDSTITRRILWKRMPPKVSHVKDYGAVDSMNKEYVKIYRKVR